MGWKPYGKAMENSMRIFLQPELDGLDWGGNPWLRRCGEREPNFSKEIRMGLFSSLSDSGMGITVITVTWESMNRPTEAKWLGKCGVVTPAIFLRLTVRILGLEPPIRPKTQETTWGEGNRTLEIGRLENVGNPNWHHRYTIQIDVVKIGRKAQIPRAWP